MNKKVFTILILSLVFLLFISSSALAQNNGLFESGGKLNMNYGYGGPHDRSSMGMEFLRNYKGNSKLGMGFFYTPNESDVSPPEYDYSIPHNDYYTKTHVSGEVGLFLIYDYQLTKSLSVDSRVGFSRIKTTDVNISRATYWSYKGNVETKTHAMYGLGFSYKINKKYDLGIGYNNRRGTVFDFGFIF
jgi:hypothetical protein